MSRGNVSALIAQLRKKGLIRQEAAADDRRCKRLSLTARGRTALGRLESGRRRANLALLGGLRPSERRVLLNALRTCLRHVWRAIELGQVDGFVGGRTSARSGH